MGFVVKIFPYEGLEPLLSLTSKGSLKAVTRRFHRSVSPAAARFSELSLSMTLTAPLCSTWDLLPALPVSSSKEGTFRSLLCNVTEPRHLQTLLHSSLVLTQDLGVPCVPRRPAPFLCSRSVPDGRVRSSRASLCCLAVSPTHTYSETQCLVA